MTTQSDAPTPAIGQIWQDKDPRAKGRFIRIDEISDTHATVRPVAWNPKARIAADLPGARRTRIRLDRFRPTSYWHIGSAEPRSWALTRKNLNEVDDAVDADGIFAKGYWEGVDGKTVCTGLRIGEGGTRQVARYGDTVTRYPDGTWTVTAVAIRQPDGTWAIPAVTDVEQ